MYEYKEKADSTRKLERHCTARQKFSDTDEPAQFKFLDEELHDKLVQCFRANSVIQFKMDAGYGDAWHIHKGHIKYGSNRSTRINFHYNDNAETILTRLDQVLQAFPGLSDKRGLKECRDWISQNY